MTREEVLFAGVVLTFMAGALLWIFMTIRELQSAIERCNYRTGEGVSEALFRIEQAQRRDLERKVDAMQEHLGLATVVQPQKTVVIKKGNAP